MKNTFYLFLLLVSSLLLSSCFHYAAVAKDTMPAVNDKGDLQDTMVVSLFLGCSEPSCLHSALLRWTGLSQSGGQIHLLAGTGRPDYRRHLATGYHHYFMYQKHAKRIRDGKNHTQPAKAMVQFSHYL